MSEKQKLKEQILEQRFKNPKHVCDLCKGLYEDAKKSNDMETMIWAKFYEADSYITLGELEQAIEKLALLLKKHEQYQTEELKDRTLNDLAVCFDLQGDHILSLDYYLKGLEVAISHKNVEVESVIYNNIGNIFLRYGDNKNASKYFEKGYKVIESVKEKEGTVGILYHIRRAQIYIYEKNIEGLQSEYEKAYAFYVQEDKSELQIVLFYLKMMIADFKEDAKLIHEYAIELKNICKGSAAIEDWDDYIAIIKILMKYDEKKDIEDIFEILEMLSEKDFMLERKRSFLILWIEYLEQTKQIEKKKQYLKEYFLLEQETKKNKDKIRLQQIRNRLLLNEKMEEQSVMQKKKKDLHESSMKDPLTSLYNRFAMIQYMEEIIGYCSVQKKEIKGALLEIQDFKELNNEYGYVIGDLCMKYLGDAIQKNHDSKMMAAHMRGNEFMIVTHEASMDQLKKCIDDIEQSIKFPFYMNDNKIQIKIHYGYFQIVPDENTTMLDVFHQANGALYGNSV